MPYLPRAGGAAVHRSTSFHPRRLSRALEQALTLHRRIRAQIGVAGFVAIGAIIRARRAISAAASFLPHSSQQSKPSPARTSENLFPQRQYGIWSFLDSRQIGELTIYRYVLRSGLELKVLPLNIGDATAVPSLKLPGIGSLGCDAERSKARCTGVAESRRAMLLA